MPELYLKFKRNEIEEEFPYGFVCESMNSARWSTGSRKRKSKEFFTEKELTSLKKIKRWADDWYLGKGVPEEVVMSESIYMLWKKLVVFCGMI